MDWMSWGIEKIADMLWDYFRGKRKSIPSGKDTQNHIIEVIKNEDTQNAILSKSKICDFNLGSILFVMPGEEAVFINNGKIEKIFKEGRYVLETSNYPFLSDWAKIISGKRIFGSNIYFVRRAVSYSLDWGTSIQVRDPVQLISTRVMCRGGYRIQVIDSKLFIDHYMGCTSEKIEQSKFAHMLKDEILQLVKTYLTEFIVKSNQEIIGIAGKQEFFAGEIANKIEDKFLKYGFKIVCFTISGIDILNDGRREVIEDAYSEKRVEQIRRYDGK